MLSIAGWHHCPCKDSMLEGGCTLGKPPSNSPAFLCVQHLPTQIDGHTAWHASPVPQGDRPRPQNRACQYMAAACLCRQLCAPASPSTHTEVLQQPRHHTAPTYAPPPLSAPSSQMTSWLLSSQTLLSPMFNGRGGCVTLA